MLRTLLRAPELFCFYNDGENGQKKNIPHIINSDVQKYSEMG